MEKNQLPNFKADETIYNDKKFRQQYVVNLPDLSLVGEAAETEHRNNYSNYKDLAENVEYYKVHEAKPRKDREHIEPGHPATQYMHARKVGYIAARMMTRDAVNALNNHNVRVKEAFAVGTPLNTKAHEQAIVEDRERQYSLELGNQTNPSNINFEGLISKNSSKSTFDKFDFIRQNADKLVDEKSLPFVTKNDTSTILLATKSEFVRRYDTNLPHRLQDVSYIDNEPYGVKLTKTEEDKIVLDVYDYKPWLDRYVPISRTTINKDGGASIENYDVENAAYSEATKLGKPEINGIYTNLIHGEIISSDQKVA